MRRRLPLVALVAILLGSAAFHHHYATNPTDYYQSTDERSYGKLAYDIVEKNSYGDKSFRDPLHWPPGYPYMLAVAHRLDPSPVTKETGEVPAGYWFQGVVSLLSAFMAFVFARLLAGPWPGVIAGGLVAFYPPLILQTGEQVSEPLGALMLMTFGVVLALVVRKVGAARVGSRFAGVPLVGAAGSPAQPPPEPGRRARAWAWVKSILTQTPRSGPTDRWGRSLGLWLLAGVMLGLVALVRADYVFLGIPMAGLVALTFLLRRRGWGISLASGAAVFLGAFLAVLPWSWHASNLAEEIVPVTRGGGAAAFVGTYLPGGGTTVGMKRSPLGDALRKVHAPAFDHRADFDLDAGLILNMVAKRHPSLDRSAALQREARINIARYVRQDPVGYARMTIGKVWRMWGRYARGGARHTSPIIRGWHLILVFGGIAGIGLGLWRTRHDVLWAALLALSYATALHMVVISHSRYNGPLMPLLIASGVAGWALWLRGRRGREASSPGRSGDPPATADEKVPAAVGA